MVHAGERLVEQKHGRVGGEADGNAERAQMAVRQVFGDLAADAAKVQEGQDFIGGLAERRLVLPGGFGAEEEVQQRL